MSSDSSFLLNRTFTRRTFKELIDWSTENSYVSTVKRYINDPEGKNNQQLISEIYQYLNKNYRNEYYYKNTLLNKLLLGVHSLKTTTALSEIPVFKSKADFVLINGNAFVYEIKTELDNLERLETQIKDYYKAFDHVVVVTCESNYQAVYKKLINTPVGIYLLTRSSRISTKKKAERNNSNLDLNIIFKILRKTEYEAILLDYYGYLPVVSQFNYYSVCCKMFREINPTEAYAMFLKELKKRNRIDIDLYGDVPFELKSIIYFSKLREIEYKKLKKFLESKFRG